MPQLKRNAAVARSLALSALIAVALSGTQLFSAPAVAAAGPEAATSGAYGRNLSGRSVPFGRGDTETLASIMARQRALTASPRFSASPAVLPHLQGGRASHLENPASSGLRSTAQPQAAPRQAATPAVAAQTPGTKFLGASFADSGIVPPDTMGAVGPTQFAVFINGRIRTFNKATGLADGNLDADTDVMFASVRNGQRTTDPHIRYDRLSGRWFLTMVTVPGSPPLDNRLLTAVSSGSTLTSTSAFTFGFVDMAGVHGIGSGCVIDYDTLGVDASAIYVGGNIFCGTSFANLAFKGSDAYVLTKAGLILGSPHVAQFQVAGSGANCPATGQGDDGLFTPQGVDNADPNASVGYFAATSVCFFGELVFARVTSPASNSPGIQLSLLAVPSTFLPNPVPAQGSTHPLDSLDDRLFMAQYRNGQVWTAHNICVDSTGASPVPVQGQTTNPCVATDRTASRWYVVNMLGAAPGLAQSGTVFDGALTSPRNYWIPSIMVSGQGHAAMGMSTAGSLEHAQATTLGRLNGDAAGSMRTPVVYQTSTSNYNLEPSPPSGVQRWGDFSYTSLDPNDDMTMWTIQEFANATDSWGVEAVKLAAPPPAALASASSNAQAAACDETIDVYGTSSQGSGFFDPGPGFANRLQAAISGGVTVKHITVVDPTHLVLNVSTEGATAGLKNLTITNPDGQAVTAPNFVSISAAGPAPATGSVVSRQQYTLSNSDGSTWSEMDGTNLWLSCNPSANHTALISANVDLFTANSGFNQDIGILASDNGGPDTLIAWKESGGFAGTFSPNAAFVQVLYPMVAGHTYVFELAWKTNKNAPGATIFAGAGPSAPFSPTSLVEEIFPTGTTPASALSNKQYTLSGSNGTKWEAIDNTLLSTTVAGSNNTVVLGANVDLFTANAGYNQDIAIFANIDNGPEASDVLVAWKESGGFAGVFSPNAAFVKATYTMTTGHTYKFLLKWKTNKNAPGSTIFAAAGTGLPYSPTSLVALTANWAGGAPLTAVSTSQNTLPNSDGSTWNEMGGTSLRVAFAPGGDVNAILGANVDLFTGNAGVNQDVAIFVQDGSGPDTLLAWKESGGFAGVFSPNAAFVQTTFRLTGGHSYTFKMMWKANKNAPGSTIYAGAGASAPFSHTRLTVEPTS